jgi:serine/threonine protein kinase/adenylate kinase family enzyme
MNQSGNSNRRSRFWRVSAWATLIFFAMAQASHALSITQIQSQEKSGPIESESYHRDLSVSFPESMGFIEETFHSETHQNTVFLIQDPHTNVSGQIHISKILKSLIDKHPQIRYVFLEAGFGDESLHFLKTLAPIEERKAVGMSFLHKGKLQGSEYFNLVEDDDTTLWGVENLGLYQESWEKYGEVVEGRQNLLSYLENIHITVRTLKPKIYSGKLLRFDHVFGQHLKGEMSFTDYMDELLTQARDSGINVDTFSQLAALEDLKGMEEEINFEKAQQEQRDAIDLLPEPDKIKLARLVKNKSFSKRLQHREQPFEVICMVLKNTFKREGILLDRFPNLVKYMDYLKRFRAMHAPLVLEEQHQLEQSVFDALTVRQDERDLRLADEGIRLLKKVASLSITPSEFDEFNRLKSRFNIPAITGLLNEMIMNLKSHYERVIFLKESCQKTLKSALDFYELTYRRDIAFVDNMMSKMTQEHQKMSILITGGYHAQHLKELLQKRGISFVSIVPQVLHETDHKRYEKRLLNLNPMDIFNSRTFFQSSILTTSPFGGTLMIPRTSFIELPQVWGMPPTTLGHLKMEKFVGKASGARFVTRKEVEDIAHLLKTHAEEANDQMDRLRRDGRLTRFQQIMIKGSKEGDLFIGKYILLDRITTKGGMSDVYKAYDPDEDYECAIKLLKQSALSDPSSLQLFESEISNTFRAQSHRHVIRAIDAGNDTSGPFLVVEYVHGYDLQRLVKIYGPLRLKKAIEFTMHAAKGLEYAHNTGVIHRDVKPSNMILDSNKGRVKVSDFGLAIGVQDRQLETDPNSSVHAGTPNFMSPEQVEESHTVTNQSDVYSLGASLYYLITGKRPYHTANTSDIFHMILHDRSLSLQSHFPDIPDELEAVFQRMVAKDISGRYGTMSDVIAALEAIHIPEDFTVDGALGRPQTSIDHFFGIMGEADATDPQKTTKWFYEENSGSRNVLSFLDELTRLGLTHHESDFMMGNAQLRLNQQDLGYRVYGFPKASGSRKVRLGAGTGRDYVQFRHAPDDRLHIRIGQTREDTDEGPVYSGGIHFMILYDPAKKDYYMRMKYWDPEMGSGEGQFVNHGKTLYFSDSSLGGVVPLGRGDDEGSHSIFIGSATLDLSDPSSFHSDASIQELMRSLEITSRAQLVIIKIGDTFAILHRSKNDLGQHETEIEPEGEIKPVEQGEPEHVLPLLTSMQILNAHMVDQGFKPGEERMVNLYTDRLGRILRVEPYKAQDESAVYAYLYQAPYSNSEKSLITVVSDEVGPETFDVDDFYSNHPGLAEHIGLINILEMDQRRRLPRQPSNMLTPPSHAASQVSSTGHFVVFPSFPEIEIAKTVPHGVNALSDGNLTKVTDLIDVALRGTKDRNTPYDFIGWVSEKGLIAAVGIVIGEKREYVWVSPHPHSAGEQPISTVNLAAWIGRNELFQVRFRHSPDKPVGENLVFISNSLYESNRYMRDVLNLILIQRASGAYPTEWDREKIIESNVKILRPSHLDSASYSPRNVAADFESDINDVVFHSRIAVDRHGLIWAIGNEDSWTHFAQNPVTEKPYTNEDIKEWADAPIPLVRFFTLMEEPWSESAHMELVPGQGHNSFSSIMVTRLNDTFLRYPFYEYNGGSGSRRSNNKVKNDGNYFYFVPGHRKTSKGGTDIAGGETSVSGLNPVGYASYEMSMLHRGLAAAGLIGPHSQLFFDLSGVDAGNLDEKLEVLMAYREMIRRRGGDLVVGNLNVPDKKVLISGARNKGLPVVDSYMELDGFTMIFSSRHLRENMPLPGKAHGIIFYDPSVINKGLITHTHTGHLITGALGISDLSRQLRSNPRARLHPRVSRLWSRKTGRSERDIRNAANKLAQAESVITKELMWAIKLFRLPLIASPLEGLQRYFKGLIEATIFT